MRKAGIGQDGLSRQLGDNGQMDNLIRDKVLAVTRLARTRDESVGYFRLSLGLYYLAGLMTREALDFKRIDRDYNRFIYQSIGKGHSITSVLQFLSGEKVVPVLESAHFMTAFREHCADIPADTIPFLLSLNLGVAKNLSGLPTDGPVAAWIARHESAGAAAANPL